jgi:hypothetical protein
MIKTRRAGDEESGPLLFMACFALLTEMRLGHHI